LGESQFPLEFLSASRRRIVTLGKQSGGGNDYGAFFLAQRTKPFGRIGCPCPKMGTGRGRPNLGAAPPACRDPRRYLGAIYSKQFLNERSYLREFISSKASQSLFKTAATDCLDLLNMERARLEKIL
jgi:hypothetical protein